MKPFKLTCILTVLMSMVGLQAFAVWNTSKKIQVGDLYYYLDTDNNQAQVTRKSTGYYWGDIVIPSSITYQDKTYSVTSIASSAFNNCEALTSVTVPNSVITIDVSAFRYCNKLTKVVLPEKLEIISDRLFEECQSLTDVTIPATVKKISYHAFNGCSSLTSISIPNSVTIIDELAFCGCKSISSIVLPSDLKEIGSMAFCACTSLGSIVIPNNVKTIGSSAFSGCSSLTSVVLPEGITEISSGLFNYCSNLTTISLPSTITQIGSNAFYGCTSLKHLFIPNNVLYIDTFRPFYGCEDAVCVNDKTEALLAIWEAGYIPYEEGTSNKLHPISVTIESTTQSTATLKLDNMREDLLYYDKYYYDQKQITGNRVVITDLCPGPYENHVRLGVKLPNSDRFHSTEIIHVFPQSLNPSLEVKSTATTIFVKGTFDEGDAVVAEQRIKIGDQTIKENHYTMTGIDPDKSFDIDYTVYVAYNSQYSSQTIYRPFPVTTTVKTEKLTLNTLPAKVVSPGNVIVAAETNISEEETNCGFEWRREDWPSDFTPNTGKAFVYDKMMEGFIRNMNTEKLWYYRPYYESTTGNKYYGKWEGIDPTNTSYFEPTVYTYETIAINGNTAQLKGYVMRGSDNIAKQGFKFWKKTYNAPHRATNVPSDAFIVEAEGNIITVELTGLDYQSEYTYVAFVTTTENETFYGEERTFTTEADDTGIETISGKSEQQKAFNVYSLSGALVRQKVTSLEGLPRGIYIINHKKVMVK